MNEKIKCSRCGGDKLQFISVPKSVKGNSTIITVFQSIAYILGLTIILFGCSFTGLGNEKLTEFLSINDILIIIGNLLFSQGIILTIAKYFIPYKNKNIIVYVCERCGKCERLEKIEIKEINNNNIQQSDNTADS